MTGPDAAGVGRVAADHLPLILFALEVCAVQLDGQDRAEDAALYRRIASDLAAASGSA